MKKDIDHLENWVTLNKGVQKLNESELQELLEREKKGERRPAFLLRIYGRYNRLRTARERQELITAE